MKKTNNIGKLNSHYERMLTDLSNETAAKINSLIDEELDDGEAALVRSHLKTLWILKKRAAKKNES